MIRRPGGPPAGGLALALLAALAWPLAAALPLRAQPAAVGAAAAEAPLSQAELEQLLAPVALFPDALLMQVLMAATYPLEIVQAERWLRQPGRAELRGEALARALEAEPWDASVKSLVPFADLLKMMSDQLAWTTQLGDALLAQQEDVLNAVQALRARAHAAGQLQSGPQQVVEVAPNTEMVPTAGVVPPPQQIITIVPASPERVYVPVYNPSTVFGPWPHAAYPPTYFPPPAGSVVATALLSGLAFAGGVAVVNSLWGWSSPAWGRGAVVVNPTRVNNINVNRTQITNTAWRHDATHRHGVAYRNERTRAEFAGRGGAAAPGQRDALRGRAEEIRQGGGLDRARPGGGDGPGVGDRPGIGDRPGGGARPGGGDRPGLGERPGGGAGAGARPGAAERPTLPDRRPEAARPGAGGGANLAERRPDGARPAPGAGAGGARPDIQRPAPGHAPSGRPTTPPQRPQGGGALQGLGGQGGDARAAAQRGAASRAAPQQRPQVQRPQGQRPAGGGAQAGARPHGGGGRR